MTSEAVLDYLLARAADPELHDRWEAQARSTGWCSHPVRLAGSTAKIDPATGEVLATFRTEAEPDGTLLKACGQRRATACPTCAATYRADAYQLIVAGLRGGKGVPDDVADWPRVFVTLTAPSFGPVHSRRQRHGAARTCHSGRVCPHGTNLECPVTHAGDDPRLGSPLCADCFDYRAAVLWNATATELWRRTTIVLRRRLAAQLGITTRQLTRQVRVSYAKVVEYQARGVVHLHAVIRLDACDDDAPTGTTAADLAAVVFEAAGSVRAPWPAGARLEGAARWGDQIDVRPIAGSGAADSVIAAYIAKYATKSTDALGHLDHRIRPSQLAKLDLPDHLTRFVHTAWQLGGEQSLAPLRLRAWAHTLGFRGHWLTKSRRYSTTLGALRAARALHVAGRHGEPTDATTVDLKDWRFAGRGWATPGDALLAATGAQQRVEARAHARQDHHYRPTEEHHGQAATHP